MNQYEQVPVPNIKEATETVLEMLADFDEENFYNKYTPQIVTTNELYQIYELQNHIKPGAKVLTVSASGEQPLFAKLYGADYVLTFDISYNAYLLTSLKIATIQTFEKHTDYEHFMGNLGGYCKPGMLLRAPKMYNVLSHLDNITKNHMSGMDYLGMPVLLGDSSCQYYTIRQNDYDKLRQLVKKPFPFIWTDIDALDKKLGDDDFDIIYYSNILDFANPEKTRTVLENTKKHLKPNGKLFLVVADRYIISMIEAVYDVYQTQGWKTGLRESLDDRGFRQIIIQREQNIR